MSRPARIARVRRPGRGGRGPRLLGALFAVLVCGLGPGCNSLKTKDRWHDAGQILDATATWGPGVSLAFRATELVQVGGGAFQGKALGWEEGRLGSFTEQRGEFGFSLLHVYEYRRDGGTEFLDYNHPRWADPGFEEYALSKNMISDRRRFDLGGSFHLGMLGVDLCLRPDEFLDFVAGWFGFDPAGDDAHARSRESLVEQARSLDARERAAAFDALLRRGEDHHYPVYTVPDMRPPAQRRAIEGLDEK